jgi:hypothetical protein
MRFGFSCTGDPLPVEPPTVVIRGCLGGTFVVSPYLNEAESAAKFANREVI